MKQKWMRGSVGLAIGLLATQAGFAAVVAPERASDTISSAGTPVLKTQEDRKSYAIGVETARKYKETGLGIDMDLLIRGIKDTAAGGKLLMTNEEIGSALIDFRGEVMLKQRGERMVAGLDNKKEGDEFLAANKTKEGVVTLSSGLQYKILKAGEGRTPTDDEMVEVHYRGTLINGTQFESTYDGAGRPATIKVSDPHVIAGLRQALKLMPVGSKWQLFIPSRLAYLATGKGPFIGPNTALIYDVEGMAIK